MSFREIFVPPLTDGDLWLFLSLLIALWLCRPWAMYPWGDRRDDE